MQIGSGRRRSLTRRWAENLTVVLRCGGCYRLISRGTHKGWRHYELSRRLAQLEVEVLETRRGDEVEQASTVRVDPEGVRDALRQEHEGASPGLDRPIPDKESRLPMRSGITKPSMVELVDELESKGYVRREPDPDDRRAKLIVPTELGMGVISLAREVIGDLEQRFREVLGAQRYDVMRSALARLQCELGSESEDPQPRAR